MPTVSVIAAPFTVRQGSVAAKVWVALAVAVPAVGRWLTRTATRLRQLALYAGGLGSICYAGWQIAEPLGWLTIGLSCLFMEGITWKPADGPR